ncbi:MAG TPA: RNA-binding domain-containing protein [Candidatus Paceibacterota bacterium]|nr:RNA-binding domain-containing protein [Candidatus Paceibacterota bacterium]
MRTTGSQASRLSVKRHPIVLVRDFLAVQFASAGGYALAGSLFHYAQLWRQTPVVSAIPYSVAQALFIFGAEAVLVMYIFMNWYRTNIRVMDSAVELEHGFFRRRRLSVPVPSAASVRVRQSLLGRLTRYGTVYVGTGKTAVRLTHVPEPAQFLHALRGAAGSAPEAAEDLLTLPEHEGLEFKSSLRWDVRERKVNRALEKAAMKTVAAFLNSRGGHLVLGIADDRTVRGVHEDIATLARKDRDGFETHVGNLFNSMIGAHLRECLTVGWRSRDGKPYCVLTVAPSIQPAYLKSDNTEEFFVRTGNGTTALTVSQAAAYMQTRFGGRTA